MGPGEADRTDPQKCSGHREEGVVGQSDGHDTEDEAAVIPPPEVVVQDKENAEPGPYESAGGGSSKAFNVYVVRNSRWSI